MTSVLMSLAVTAVLRRLHAKADDEDEQAKQRVRAREAELGIRLRPQQRYELYGDAPLAIAREVGYLYYVLALTRRARNIVEFGASHGISTIYLAAAMRDGEGGSLITTEILPHKAEMARQNLVDARLDDLVEIRVGDALETLQDTPADIDMVVLDGRNDQYVPVLDLVRHRLAPGAVIAADLGKDDPDLRAYQEHVRSRTDGFVSLELPLDAGIELTVKLPDPTSRRPAE